MVTYDQYQSDDFFYDNDTTGGEEIAPSKRFGFLPRRRTKS
jgi:hypothetical protein